MDDQTLDALMVSKSNALIEARQALTLNEQRLLVLAAAQLDPEGPMPVDGIVHFRVADFARQFEIDRDHAYEAVKDAAKRMYHRNIVTEETTKRGVVQREVRLVWSAEYKEGEGAISIGFTPKLAPYLTQLSKRISYTTIPVRMLGRLSSAFAFRLFEIASVHRDGPTHEYTLDQVRAMFGVDSKYPEWRDLQRVVLAGAVAMVNAETNLHVTLKPVRQMRKYVAIKLTAKSQAEPSTRKDDHRI